MRAYVLGLALLSSVFAGCAHGREFAVPYEPVRERGVVSIWVNHLEDDGDKFDVKLNVKNDSSGWVIVRSEDIRMLRGDVECRVKHANFGIGERVIDIAPGQTKTAALVGVLPGLVDGPYRVVVAKVYANPPGDGRALGEVVAEGLEWKFSAPQ